MGVLGVVIKSQGDSAKFGALRGGRAGLEGTGGKPDPPAQDLKPIFPRESHSLKLEGNKIVIFGGSGFVSSDKKGEWVKKEPEKPCKVTQGLLWQEGKINKSTKKAGSNKVAGGDAWGLIQNPEGSRAAHICDSTPPNKGGKKDI